jgi:hypothetical protein
MFCKVLQFALRLGLRSINFGCRLFAIFGPSLINFMHISQVVLCDLCFLLRQSLETRNLAKQAAGISKAPLQFFGPMLLEICPRGNNKIVIILFHVY